MIGRESLNEGMTVRSADGEKLGKVIALGASQFQIEKGIFFRKDYVADYSAISDIREGEVFLSGNRDTYREAYEEAAAGTPATGSMTTEQEVSMPLMGEELEVQKRERSAGSVQLKKEVVTEQRQVTIPVEKERVRIEHVAATDSTATATAIGKDESISIPLKEEEVEIRKRPVVRGEVRLKKEREIEHRAISEDLQHEEASVRTEGAVESVRGSPPLEDPNTRR